MKGKFKMKTFLLDSILSELFAEEIVTEVTRY